MEVAFAKLADPIRPKDHIDRIRPTLPKKYSPLQKNGNGIQAVYLASVPHDMADALVALLGGQVERITANLGRGR